MNNTLLERIRTINKLLQESTNGGVSFYDLCDALGTVISAKVCIINRKGRVIGSGKDVCFAFSEETSQKLLEFDETVLELPKEITESLLENDEYSLKCGMVPVIAASQRLGTLIIACNDTLDEEIQALSELSATIIGAFIVRRMLLEKEEQEREREGVQMALSSLSYSELEAILEIFKALDGNTGVIVARKIAAEKGLTRSVIVNAVRKLESAGMIEATSLGMKGTFIKVLKPKLIDVLSKYSM